MGMGDYLMRQLVTGEGWLVAMTWFTRPLYLAMILATAALLYWRGFNRWILVVAGVAGLVLHVALDFSFKPLAWTGVDWMLHLTWLALSLSLGLAFSVSLLIVVCFRKKRTVDRVATGVAMLATVLLLSLHHIVIISGMMKSTQLIQSDYLRSSLFASEAAWDEICSLNEWDCLSGPVDDRLPATGPDVVRQEMRDYIGHIRQQAGDRPILFSHSGGIPDENSVSFAFAYRQEQGLYRLAAERRHAQTPFDAAEMAYIFVANTIIAFWAAGAGLVIVAHRRRFARRRRSA